MDAWLAYAPVKNNPEDAAKVLMQSNDIFKIIYVVLRQLNKLVTELIKAIPADEYRTMCLLIVLLCFPFSFFGSSLVGIDTSSLISSKLPTLLNKRYPREIHTTVQLLEKWPSIVQTASF